MGKGISAVLVLAGLAAGLAGGPATAGSDFDKAALERLFTGRTLAGTYLRGNRDYAITYAADGTFTSSSGSRAKWWISDAAEYCREYVEGPLKGNRACFEVKKEGDGIALYFKGRKTATGTFAAK
ncbi:MAG: hypothetical protein H6907_19295 [Hyphomicrobiales bacterium]|nr:hypothetical protein [Hyphomicrobiales bacterium]MCP5373883.1 hypothetical protein [Hyphomicrobiales bacterium]